MIALMCKFYNYSKHWPPQKFQPLKVKWHFQNKDEDITQLNNGQHPGQRSLMKRKVTETYLKMYRKRLSLPKSFTLKQLSLTSLC